MTEVSPAELAKFIRSLAILALPFEGQLAWLNSLGLEVPEVDELAHELDDALLLAPQFVRAGWVSERTLQLAKEVDAFLASFSGPSFAGFWDVSSLRHSEHWDEVRRLSNVALQSI